jgi:hypothetical protein
MAVLAADAAQSRNFSLNSGRAAIFTRAQDIDATLWAQAFADTPKDLGYYRLLEETMADGFVYRYLVLFGSDDVPYALQPLIIVEQDLAASLTAALARVIATLRRLVPRFLRKRMLMAGCLVGDGHLGVIDPDRRREAATALAEALLRYAKSEGISFITVKDFSVDDRANLEPLIAAGFTRLDGYPSLRLPLDFRSFEQYLEEKLSKITRKGLRRKLRKSAEAIPPIELEVIHDCADVIDEIYPLYCEVARRGDVSFEVFTKEYFVEAGRRFPDRSRFFIWRQNGKAVAFSFCTVWRDTIYDNDIGFDYSVAHELNLYHVSFRDILEWALAHGLKFYHSAPFNYEPKLHLRLELVPHDLYVRHTAPLINWAMRRFAPYFSPGRSDPVLRKHLNRTPA